MIAATLAFTIVGWGGSANPGQKVARAAGATSCAQSQWFINFRLDHSKLRVFNCMIDGRLRCVTYAHGVAQDATALARVVFQQSLSGRPRCLS